MLYLGGGAREVCLMPFLVIRIILCLRPHSKLSRYGTAIEDSLEASRRTVLPALQAAGRCSDNQEMAGAAGAAARGAIEAGERGGDQPQADSAGTLGVEGGRGEGRGMRACGFSQGEGGGRKGATAGISTTLLSSVLGSGCWRRFGGG